MSFRMPPVEVGQTVLWSHGPNDSSPPGPAVVVQVGDASIAVVMHAKDRRDHILHSGVRHRDDPFLRAHPAHDGGCWDLTPRDKQLNALLEAFESKPKKQGA
jgi:hypothetical protein